MFDFLKRKKQTKGRGVRSTGSKQRDPNQPTGFVPLPPRPNSDPNRVAPPVASPMPPARPAPENRTVVRPVNPQPMPQAPVPPPAIDSGQQTQYIVLGESSAGEIVGVLVAIEGELTGQVFKVKDGTNQVGRGSDCDIELNSAKISRPHAEIIHQNGMFVIKPLNAKNPTFLNENQTEGDELGDGDLIRLGLTTLKFRTI